MALRSVPSAGRPPRQIRRSKLPSRRKRRQNKRFKHPTRKHRHNPPRKLRANRRLRRRRPSRRPPQPEPARQQQTYTQSAYQSPAPARESKVVGTGAFFGLIFLFAIPVIGWLACLIMAFASKNKNIKHYARAMLIWIVIGLVFAVIGYFVFRWLGGALMDYINQATDGAFGEWGDIFEQFKQFQNGGSSLPLN